MRALVSSGFSEGHAFPALALSRGLCARGHEVHVGVSRRWREPIDGLGAGFVEVEEYDAFPDAGHEPATRTIVEATRELESMLADLRPDVVVSDFASPAPALAAELAGVPNVSLIATVYPVQGAGLPPFPLGLLAPRTRAGAMFWRATEPLLRPLRPSTRWLARVPDLLDGTRSMLGLEPLRRDRERITTFGMISDELALVATFPQLEYPRRWPAHVHVTGPMPFELPWDEVELPPGDAPLVLVATSTATDPGFELVRTALAGLAGEPVRVIATLNRPGASWPRPIPANAAVVDWLSYRQVMAQASLVVTSGGQGTVIRALVAGSPVLVCPTGADTAENGARVTWAGVGQMLARRLRTPAALRRRVQRLLCDPAYSARAGVLSAWAREHDGAERGAKLIESYVLGSEAR